jgi:ankyrin repeat protein
MIAYFRYIAAAMLFLCATITIVGSGFELYDYTGKNLYQSSNLSEKEWQFDNSSGVPVWIALNSTTNTLPFGRDIYILLDKDYFKRESLTRLFTHYSEKYGDPVWLIIQAFSDKETLRQVMVIDKLSGADIDWTKLPDSFKRGYGLPLDLNQKKNHGLHARFYRDLSKEYFDYTPSLRSKALDRVFLRKMKEDPVREKTAEFAINERGDKKENLGKPLPQSIDLNARDEYGRTQLLIALGSGLFDTARMLIELGAGVNECAPGGYCPLAYAAESGHTEIVALLIAKGAEVNTRDEFGNTALMKAAGIGKKEIVNLLLKHGADINAQDTLSRTVLMRAWDEFGKTEVVELLLKSGANIEATDHQRDTALMYAVRAGRLETVKLLLKYGAKVDAKNNYGQTAMDYAKIAAFSQVKGAEDIIRILQQATSK